MSTQETLDHRVTELEIKLAYQQDVIEGLNDVVTKQSAEIERLTKYTKDMTDEIRRLRDQSPGDTQDPPPPHY